MIQRALFVRKDCSPLGSKSATFELLGSRLISMFVRKLLSITALILAFSVVPGIAIAEEGSSAELVDFAVDDGFQAPVSIDEFGDAYIEVPLTKASPSLFTWLKPKGVWNDPLDLQDDVKSFAICLASMNEAEKLQDFPLSPEDSTALLTGIPVDGPNAALVVEIAGCIGKSESISELVNSIFDLTSNQDGSNASTVSIPYAKYGAGEHSLGIYTPEFNQDCFSSIPEEDFSFEDVKQVIASGCNFMTFKESTVTIVVPELTKEQEAEVEKVQLANGKVFSKETTFSGLRPIDFGIFTNLAKFLQPVTVAAGISVVLTVLVALPTSLMQSSLDANRTRVNAFLARNGARLRSLFNRKGTK